MLSANSWPGLKRSPAEPMADELSFLFRWRAAVLSKDCDLSSTARLVGIAVSMRMNSDGASAFPGGTELAERTGLSLRTIRRAEEELVSSAWLTLIEQGGSRRGSRRKANHYAASFPTTDDTETPVTSDTDTPVESHRCQIRQGPVTKTTRTGVTAAHQEVQELVHKQVTAVEAEFDRLVTAIGDKYAASSATESYVIGLIEDTFGEGDDRRQKAVDHYRARVEEFKTFPRREAETTP